MYHSGQPPPSGRQFFATLTELLMNQNASFIDEQPGPAAHDVQKYNRISALPLQQHPYRFYALIRFQPAEIHAAGKVLRFPSHLVAARAVQSVGQNSRFYAEDSEYLQPHAGLFRQCEEEHCFRVKGIGIILFQTERNRR